MYGRMPQVAVGPAMALTQAGSTGLMRGIGLTMEAIEVSMCVTLCICGGGGVVVVVVVCVCVWMCVVLGGGGGGVA